jgi:hypothetical protein
MWRQMALYELDPAPNAFLRWAYRPTRDRLAAVLEDVFAAARRTLRVGELAIGHVRWLLRLIGVRMAWDKRWREPGSRTDGQSILVDALQYPTRVTSAPDINASELGLLASVVAAKLGTVHLGAADGGLLSQLLQEGGIPPHLQRERKIYPTPQHVAWRMVQTLPFEALPRHERRVWDGTCGSGTILVAALERLRALVPELEGAALRQHLVSSISGNDLAEALADATRMALDQALGAPAGPDWAIRVGDVADALPEDTERRPTIIAGNPPFKASGHTPDEAIGVVQGYVHALPSGGLMSVVVPASLAATDAARSLRVQLVHGFDLFEVWELPRGSFRGTEQETAVIMGRKRPSASATDNVVTWRRFGRNQQLDLIGAVRQARWLVASGAPFRPPLALDLEDQLADSPRLGTYVPRLNRSLGITPGKANRDAVLQAPEEGAEPYLRGREGMLPFYIPWKERPAWLRYSRELQWDRPQYYRLFKSPKVLISRHATWGDAWRVRAAVDTAGLLPSDQFVAIRPEQPLSLDFVAALFNSALANCWLKLVNPAFTTTLSHMLSLPVPANLSSLAVRRAESLARQLAQVRAVESAPADELVRLTLDLDSAIYDAYEVSPRSRSAISSHFLWHGDARDGFDGPTIAAPDGVDGVFGEGVFSDTAAERLQELTERSEERSLSAAEDAELQRLIDWWQRASIDRARRAHPVASSDASEAAGA